MKPSLKIVAIGGGQIKTSETFGIDSEIVRLTGKKRPRALFIPTASGDAEGYIEDFKKIYGEKLGCKTRNLKLIKNPPTDRDIAALVLGSDLIYVGGGNTYQMMKIWRRTGLDAVLKQAVGRGIVLSGLSAGAVCWFKFGHSDSRSFSGNQNWSYMRVRGLGFVHALYCPHYHVEKRELPLSQMIAKQGGLAIACDDNAAFEVVDDTYRIITSKAHAKAYKIFLYRKKIVRQQLEVNKQYKSLENLFTRAN